MKKILVVALFALAGCGQHCPATKLYIGMTQQEVLNLCGEPTNTWDREPNQHVLTESGHDMPETHHRWFYHHGFAGLSVDYVSIEDGKVNYANSDD